VIRYAGSGHRIGHPVWHDVRLVVKRDDEAFFFDAAMTREAGIGFRDLDGDRLDALLTAAGLDELERRLRAGIFPPEEGDYDTVLFTSDQYDLLRAIADREKHCVWQERLARGWICKATPAGGNDRTTATLCASCVMPDARVLCVHLMHPTIELDHDGSGPTRSPSAPPLCNRRIRPRTRRRASSTTQSRGRSRQLR
jgi:hypothetical protein